MSTNNKRPGIDAFHSALGAVAHPALETIIAQYVEELFRRVALAPADTQMDRTLREMLTHLEAGRANEYVNLACEIGAASHFKERHAADFEYQVTKPASPGDKGLPVSFDFAFRDDGAPVNVEVKNLSRSWTPRGPTMTLKSFLPAQHSNFLHGAGVPLEGTSRKAVRENLDKANGQLWREEMTRVALLCANNLDDYADAAEVIWGVHGLLKDGAEIARLPSIDVIVVSNYGFLHHCMLDMTRHTDFYMDRQSLNDGAAPWQFNGAFSLAGALAPKAMGEARIAHISRAFNVINHSLAAYRKEHPGQLQEALFALFRTIPLRPAQD